MKMQKVKVLKNHKIADNLFKMTLFAPQISYSAYPGQFVHIKIPRDKSLLLRRPISINGAYPEEGRVDLVFQVVGKGTQILSKVEKDTDLDVLGPLGRGFWIQQGTKRIFIVGGGCGVAPIRFIGQKWGNLDITSFLGFRSKSVAYQIRDFENFSTNVYIATDDGSLGYKGSIISLLKEKLCVERPDVILSCGPLPMLKALRREALDHDIPCQISLEERMGCGVGGCLVCSCAVISNEHWDYKKVCTDGPVFWSKEVLLDGELGSKR